MSERQVEASLNRSLCPDATVADAIALHWPEYLMEGAELAIFMIVACLGGTVLFYVDSPIVRGIPSSTVRLVLMGLVMGGSAMAITLSPMGRRSGAHFNPAVSLTFWFLGRMHWLDTVFYALAHFVGGLVGVVVAWALIGKDLAAPSVRYVVTVPGHYGVAAAFLAEYLMGFVMLTVVLQSNGRTSSSRYTWLFAGLLVMTYVIAFSGVSGFSINPARTVASAVFANVWTAMWLYFLGPALGMLSGAWLYVSMSGPEAVRCAKVYHDRDSSCPFYCRVLWMPDPSALSYQPKSTAKAR